MEGWSLKTHLLSHVVEPLGSEKFPPTGPPASGPWFSCRDPGKFLVERTLQVFEVASPLLKNGVQAWSNADGASVKRLLGSEGGLMVVGFNGCGSVSSVRKRSNFVHVGGNFRDMAFNILVDWPLHKAVCSDVERWVSFFALTNDGLEEGSRASSSCWQWQTQSASAKFGLLNISSSLSMNHCLQALINNFLNLWTMAR